MSPEEALELATRNVVEVVTLEELKKAFESGAKLRGYLGYEPSGLFHVGWVIWANKVKDLVEAGVDFILLEATWHAWVNDKLGGSMQAIREASLYVRHCLKSLGVPIERMKFVDAEELVSDKEYWSLLLKVAKRTSLKRLKRALTIMGRRAEEAELDSSKLIYPLMQVTDILYMDLDLAVGGLDQRKAHMLAREVAEKLGRKKVIALHTPLLTSLEGVGRAGGGVPRLEELEVDDVYSEVKMSKSKPESTILIHDSPSQVKSKVRRAYCPPRETRFNPVMEINKYLLFARKGFVLKVERPEKYGGYKEYWSYEELEKDYVSGALHPADLKEATAEALAEFLRPSRRYFATNKEARELAVKVAKYQGLELSEQELLSEG